MERRLPLNFMQVKEKCAHMAQLDEESHENSIVFPNIFKGKMYAAFKGRTKYIYKTVFGGKKINSVASALLTPCLDTFTW